MNDEPQHPPAAPPETFSVAQLCRRWQVGEDRIHAMIRAGKLAAFALPSAGRFGRKLRVTLAAVLEAERAWAVLPARSGGPKPRPAGRGVPELRHLRPRDGQLRAEPHGGTN